VFCCLYMDWLLMNWVGESRISFWSRDWLK
jgi:hypothetical protein